jgi:hypothetical protein
MFGTIDLIARPLKLGFLVDPHDEATVRKVVQINSVLCGGSYNPFIPVVKKTPAEWADRPFKPPSPGSVAVGYIEAFDPDILVKCSDEVPDYIPAQGRKVVPVAYPGRPRWRAYTNTEVWDRYL